MTADFTFGPEPAWLVCGACKARTMRSPCWGCTQTQRAGESRSESILARAKAIPAGYRWASLASTELAGRISTTEPIADVAARVLAGAGVLFAGPAGAGKTSMAVACLRERLDTGGTFMSAISLGSAPIERKAGDIVDMAMRAPLLLIDDVGSERNTSVNAVPEVIFLRHERELATWITTGLRFAELQSRYGDGIARRITERVVVVKLGAQRDAREIG